MEDQKNGASRSRRRSGHKKRPAFSRRGILEQRGGGYELEGNEFKKFLEPKGLSEFNRRPVKATFRKGWNWGEGRGAQDRR